MATTIEERHLVTSSRGTKSQYCVDVSKLYNPTFSKPQPYGVIPAPGLPPYRFATARVLAMQGSTDSDSCTRTLLHDSDGHATITRNWAGKNVSITEHVGQRVLSWMHGDGPDSSDRKWRSSCAICQAPTINNLLSATSAILHYLLPSVLELHSM